MKRMTAAVILALALPLAACSSTAPAADNSTTTSQTTQTTETTDTAKAEDKTTTDTQSTTETTSEAAEEKTTSKTTDNSASTQTIKADSNSKLASLTTAFQNAGFTTYDIDIEADEVSFDARNNNGSAEVDGNQYASLAAARAEYQSDLDDLNHDGYVRVNTYTTSNGEVTELLNDWNTVYAYVAVDNDNCTVYEIQDILEPNRTPVLNALQNLGFSK